MILFIYFSNVDLKGRGIFKIINGIEIVRKIKIILFFFMCLCNPSTESLDLSYTKTSFFKRKLIYFL